MQGAASGECGRPCVGGFGSPAKANYDVPLTPHDTGSEKSEPGRRSRIWEWVNGPKTYCRGTITRVHLHTQMHRPIRPANFMRFWTMDDVVRDAGEPATQIGRAHV